MLLRINLEYLEFTQELPRIILCIDLDYLDYLDYIDYLLSDLIYSKPAFGDSNSDEEDVMLDDAQLASENSSTHNDYNNYNGKIYIVALL